MSASTTIQRPALTLAAMSLGYAVVQLDVTIVNVAVASIGHALGGGIAAQQWVVTAYTTVFAALILTAGALGDRIGARRVFAAGFAIFTAASLACALAPSLGVLIAARALQGIGAATLVPNSLALLNHSYPEDKARGWAVAIWAAGASVALTAGPLIGGALIAVAGWRAIFLVNVPLGLGAIWLALRYTAETPTLQQRTIDIPGQLTGIAALGCLSGAIIEGGRLGWTSPAILAGFAAAFAAAAAFIVIERRSASPIMPLSLFGSPLFSAAAVVGLLVNVAFYGLIFVFSLYFQQADHWSPFRTGVAFVPMVATVFVTNLAAPRISARIGAPITVATGAAIVALGCVTLLGCAQGTPYIDLVAQFAAMGAGVGLLVPPLTSMLLGSVDKSRSGVASGILNSMRQIGSVLGVAVFGSMVATHQLLPGLHISLAIATALLALSALISLAGARRPA